MDFNDLIAGNFLLTFVVVLAVLIGLYLYFRRGQKRGKKGRVD